MTNPWRDNPEEGKSRPTPERRSKGVYRLGRVEKDGDSVAIDAAAQPLLYARERGVISERQFDAACKFEILARKMRGGVGQRSCLDFSPVGYDHGEDDEQAEAEWSDIRKLLGFAGFQAVSAVAYYHDDIRNIDLLRQSLDCIGDYFGLAKH